MKHAWDINNTYIEKIGYRGQEKEIPTLHKLPTGLARVAVHLEDNVNSPLERVTWQLHFTGPVLTNDPMAALLEEETDSVFYQKTKVLSNQSSWCRVWAQ